MRIIRKHSYYDYEKDIGEERDNDVRYENGDHICPVCGARMKEYIDPVECYGTVVWQKVWECPEGC